MDEYILAIHLLVQLMETGKDKRMELWQAMSRRERIQCMCVCGGADMEGGGNEVLWNSQRGLGAPLPENEIPEHLDGGEQGIKRETST